MRKGLLITVCAGIMMIAQTSFAADCPAEATECYDEQGRIIKDRYRKYMYDTTGRQIDKSNDDVEFEFDSQGRLSKIIGTLQDENYGAYVEYTYDGNTVTRRFDTTACISLYSCSSGSLSDYSDYTKAISTYDDNGKLIREEYYDENDNNINGKSLQYDSHGNMTSITYLDSNGEPTSTETFTYEYDANGNMIYEHENGDDFVSIYEYDDHGNETKRTVYDCYNCSDLTAPDPKTMSCCQDYDLRGEYKYEYDDYGNAISKSHYDCVQEDYDYDGHTICIASDWITDETYSYADPNWRENVAKAQEPAGIPQADGSIKFVDDNGNVRYEGKRIYTVQEALEVSGPKNRFRIRYK